MGLIAAEPNNLQGCPYESQSRCEAIPVDASRHLALVFAAAAPGTLARVDDIDLSRLPQQPLELDILAPYSIVLASYA